MPAPRTSPGAQRRAWTAVAAVAVLLALLAWAVTAPAAPLLRVDRAVSTALYAGDGRPAAVDTLLQVATAPGLSVVRYVVYLPVLAWLGVRRAWRAVAWVALAVLLVAPLTTAVKDAVGRERPRFADGGARYDSLSFPSGHASGVATLVTVGLLLSWPLLAPSARRIWLTAGIALAVLVGLTRLWLGVHWLSDVVGGWALGAGWTVLVALVSGGLPGGRGALPVAARSSTAALR